MLPHAGRLTIGRRLTTPMSLTLDTGEYSAQTVGPTPLDPLFDQPNQSDALPERPTGGRPRTSKADQGVAPGSPYIF
jgi:hypothetical protein